MRYQFIISSANIRDVHLIFNNTFLHEFTVRKYRGARVTDAQTKQVSSKQPETEKPDSTFTASI